MKESFVDNCNEYVDQIECTYLTWLLTQETNAEEKRNKCRCQSCMSEPARIGRMISEELERLAPLPTFSKKPAIYKGGK